MSWRCASREAPDVCIGLGDCRPSPARTAATRAGRGTGTKPKIHTGSRPPCPRPAPRSAGVAFLVGRRHYCRRAGDPNDTHHLPLGRRHGEQGHFGDLIRTFQDPNAKGVSWFGESVAVVGDNVLVGAPMNNVAYLFEGSTGKLLRTFVAPPKAKAHSFGWCVAAAGRNVVIADKHDATEGRLSGRVYLFNGLTGNLLHTL